MSTFEETLCDLVRKIVREEMATTNVSSARTYAVGEVHQSTPSGPTAWITAWINVDSVELTGATGVRTYEAIPGHPVRVRGYGKKTAKNPEGAAQSGWKIKRITHREGDPSDINVEVTRGNVLRTVKASKLEYVRPR